MVQDQKNQLLLNITAIVIINKQILHYNKMKQVSTSQEKNLVNFTRFKTKIFHNHHITKEHNMCHLLGMKEITYINNNKILCIKICLSINQQIRFKHHKLILNLYHNLAISQLILLQNLLMTLSKRSIHLHHHMLTKILMIDS